ncbi:MAG: hypothetical protein BWY76_01797 [bacterium ADurb.Bin429]|nr:MAG: hypothetical protein BWY76_01797 [bacterium ADurb.Bin429]
MRTITILIFLLSLAAAAVATPTYPWLNTPPKPENRLEQRIAVPRGFTRVAVAPHSFGEWLRGLPLKPGCPPVTLYNGEPKGRQDMHAAVVDLDVGTRDLQQCADAVMRLRGEYLYSRKNYAAIHFNFTSGFRAVFAKWAQGYRVSVRGNRVSWIKRAAADSSHASFRAYMDTVFTYAGTASLSKELLPVKVEAMRIGDVFIRGGFPGHAVIVADMAKGRGGKTRFLLAQSYMPAQQVHLLKNPADGSPWYPLDFGAELVTPEYVFTRGELKRFR